MSIYNETNIRRLFVVSLLVKAFDGILEVLLGIAFFFTSATAGLLEFLIRGELVEDPTDFLANTVQQFIPFLLHNPYFVPMYLLSHGIIKLVLIVGLLQNKLWAYPSAIAVFLAFIVYQVYQYTSTSSVWLIVLTVFDIIVILLTWHEYRVLKKRTE